MAVFMTSTPASIRKNLKVQAVVLLMNLNESRTVVGTKECDSLDRMFLYINTIIIADKGTWFM